jgi:chromosome segregation ATPase
MAEERRLDREWLRSFEESARGLSDLVNTLPAEEIRLRELADVLKQETDRAVTTARALRGVSDLLDRVTDADRQLLTSLAESRQHLLRIDESMARMDTQLEAASRLVEQLETVQSNVDQRAHRWNDLMAMAEKQVATARAAAEATAERWSELASKFEEQLKAASGHLESERLQAEVAMAKVAESGAGLNKEREKFEEAVARAQERIGSVQAELASLESAQHAAREAERRWGDAIRHQHEAITSARKAGADELRTWTESMDGIKSQMKATASLVAVERARAEAIVAKLVAAQNEIEHSQMALESARASVDEPLSRLGEVKSLIERLIQEDPAEGF